VRYALVPARYSLFEQYLLGYNLNRFASH
jgi:hypothetical protein